MGGGGVTGVFDKPVVTRSLGCTKTRAKAGWQKSVVTSGAKDLLLRRG